MHMLTFIETRLFSRLVSDYLTDEEYTRLQTALAANPEAGPVIPGSGGVRKLRWHQAGRGKRGGIRVIYYVKRQDGVIWLLTLYAENEIQGISAEVLRRLKREVDG